MVCGYVQWAGRAMKVYSVDLFCDNHKMTIILTPELECMVEGCANCLDSSSVVCEECENGLTRAENGSSCMATTVLVASTAATTAGTTATQPTPSTAGGISMDQLIGTSILYRKHNIVG